VARDDIVQEASIAAWSAAGRWRANGGSSFTAFVTARTVGAVRDVLRAHSPSTRGGRARPVLVPLDQTTDFPSMERDTVLDIDLRETLDRALDRLPPKQRHVVVQRFFHHRTNGDVGRDLGLTESAVSLISKGALNRLQLDVDLRDWIGLAA
jgi:RNA polymerase sigma factor (sigma-70 family)